MARVRSPLFGATILISISSASLVFAQEVTCYVDSQGGDDSRSGLSEAEAVKSQSAIDGSCSVARFKRGSVFNEALAMARNVTTYTNYGDASQPLPQFVVPRTPSSGPVVQGMMQSDVTIDGLYLAGASGDGTMQGLIGGVCVMLGGNSQLINNEIANCDIGVMVFGEGSVVRGNYIHDLIMGVDAAPGVDPNTVGGAEGIFVNASNTEVSYNTFVRCKGPAEWVGQNGGCDGGATEVTVGACETLTGVRIHHNFSYDNCGFFEVSSGFGDCKGTFADSEFYANVSIDSGWMALLQVNNTDLSNIRWTNNTFVQREGSTNAGILAIVFTDTSSGMTGGDLLPNTVFLTNNLYVLDGVQSYGELLDADFAQTTNLIIDTAEQDPGFSNLDGTAAADFDLVAGSPAIDAGTLVASHTLDFLNRAVPNPGGVTDVGAFEYGSTEGSGGGAIVPASGGAPNSGGSGGAAGSSGGATSDGGAEAGGASGGSAGAVTSGSGGAAAGSGGAAAGSGGATGSGGAATGGGAASTSGGAATSGGSSTGGSGGGSSCASPLQLCGGSCVDVASDGANCGSCGRACPGTEVCSAGVCGSACGAGLMQCGPSCVDVMTSLVSCGNCGVACSQGQSCRDGTCVGTATGGPITDPTPSSTGGGDDGGCACRAAGHEGPSSAGALGSLLAMGLILARRRRRSPGIRDRRELQRRYRRHGQCRRDHGRIALSRPGRDWITPTLD